jgi:hypothetical protein
MEVTLTKGSNPSFGFSFAFDRPSRSFEITRVTGMPALGRLEAHDVLVAVNGRACTQLTHAEVVDLIRPASIVHLLVRRGRINLTSIPQASARSSCSAASDDADDSGDGQNASDDDSSRANTSDANDGEESDRSPDKAPDAPSQADPHCDIAKGGITRPRESSPVDSFDSSSSPSPAPQRVLILDMAEHSGETSDQEGVLPPGWNEEGPAPSLWDAPAPHVLLSSASAGDSTDEQALSALPADLSVMQVGVRPVALNKAKQPCSPPAASPSVDSTAAVETLNVQVRLYNHMRFQFMLLEKRSRA